jgi:hypothetical protein
MGETSINIDGYQRWATGNLVDNRNRGIFAEWMIGQALDCIEPDACRVEWDSYDLLYKDIKVEVKASGLSQTWNPNNATTPRFTISGQKWTWLTEDEATTRLAQGLEVVHRLDGAWAMHDPPSRPADVYVFCLHQALPATNTNVADPATWTFWVISTKTLNAAVGNQKSIGIKKLDQLGERTCSQEIRQAIDNTETG